ncbi:hypothetical protein [Falsiroseomonas sp. HW251]|uniref:hypothetical protein n=1 Tax=Falsiroseomonas sp. HW251 TaxID=3390998 RepID=UPI003D322977
MHDNEFDFLIVPSRGAAPIVDACTVYWTSRRERSDHRGGLDRVVRSFLSNPITKAMYLPFTADIGNLDIGVSPRDVRRFWCRVVAGMLRAPNTDPFYNFYVYLRSKFCAHPTLEPRANTYQIDGIPRGRKFAFIDTAVSGQAICEIMDGFSEAGLDDVLYIIIIDLEGKRLKPLYRKQLEAAQQQNKAFLIYTKRLFTEDRGPAISGIWSVVFPELIEQMRTIVPEFRDLGCAGAGLYYWTVGAATAPSDTIIHTAVTLRRAALIRALIYSDHSPANEALKEYRGWIQRHDLFERRTTQEIARPRLEAALQVTPRDVQASSSHVVRVSISKDDADSVVRDFQKSRAAS